MVLFRVLVVDSKALRYPTEKLHHGKILFIQELEITFEFEAVKAQNNTVIKRTVSHSLIRSQVKISTDLNMAIFVV